MKKHFFLFLLSIVLLSCSKGGKVTLTGKITNGSPLERIELIETSGIATLPIANFGVDAKGNFSQTVDIPKDGVYVFTFGGRTGFLYLKGGDKVDLQIDAVTFPIGMKITGDAKGNTEYIQQSQEFINQYMSKLDQNILMKKEEDFLKELDKYKAEIEKKFDEIAKIQKPDSDVEKFNKRELDVTMLMVSSQYETLHGQFINDANYKPSQKFTDYQKNLEDESFLEDKPSYRMYLVNKISKEVQQYFEKNKNANISSNTQLFANFLETKKDMSAKTKDYLMASVATRFDVSPNNPKMEELIKLLDSKIKTQKIKDEVKRLAEAVYGLPKGTDFSKTELIGQDGKSTSLASMKGRPTAVVFYASWNPYIAQNAVPVIKEMVKFYGAKMNFAFVNLDDTQEQFGKSSKAVFGGIKGSNFYGKGGMNAEIAKQFAIYGFKMPSVVILDKDAKVMSKTFLSVGDPELVDALNRASGLQTPAAMPQLLPEQPAVTAPVK